MKKTEKKYSDIIITDLPKSAIEIKGSIPEALFTLYRKQALQNINESITIDGFRKGKIPENVLVSKVGDKTILEEMAELALAEAYPAIIVEKNIDAIGRPEIKITKIASGNPLEFTITTSVMPKIALPDYKKIAKNVMAEVEKSMADKNALAVDEKEIAEAITRIQRSYAERNHVHSESHKDMTKEEHSKVIEADMPAIDDVFVQKLGQFKDVADFKQKIKGMLIEDKKSQAKEKRRIALSDALNDATKIDVPELLIKSEVRRTEAQFADDISRMGISLDDYLKHAKKTIEEIRLEWAPQAEKKAKLQMIMNAIAETEKIKADQKEIEEEVSHILEHYKDGDAERAAIYAETVLTNEKIFRFLEEQKN
jgi:trigger factor